MVRRKRHQPVYFTVLNVKEEKEFQVRQTHMSKSGKTMYAIDKDGNEYKVPTNNESRFVITPLTEPEYQF